MDERTKRVIVESAKEMKSGYERRNYMARVVVELLDGCAYRAEKELGWNRRTVKKALDEWEGGFCYIDQYYKRGRKKAEEEKKETETGGEGRGRKEQDVSKNG